MIALATSRTEAATQPDLRRITEADPDYQQLHATTVARLQRSVRQYAREVKRGDPGADTRFINRHIALMRQAYQAAHHAGQKDYWPAVSTRTVQHRFVAADPEQANKRLTYYALGSVLKMAHEVKAYQAAQKTAALDESIHLAAPADIPGSFDNRVALQGQIVWSGLQDGYSDAGASDSASPYAALYWNLGPVKTEHCEDCPDLAFGSPYDPPWAGAGSNQLTQSPGDGQTECGAACKCALSYEYPSGDALEQLNQAIADRWTQFMADGSGLPTITNGAVPAKGTVLTPLQRGYMDEYRNAQDAWEEARGSLPAAPGMFNGGDWTGAKLTPWGAMTPYQQNIIARMEQVQIDWLHAAGELNWPTPAYTPDQETAIMGWLRKASQSSRWIDPPYIPSPEQQSLSWLSDVAAANLWPEPPVGDQESAMMVWLRDVAKRMQWGTQDGSSQQMQEAIDSIKLYNPNHDARGRFTTGSGASTTVARGQGRTRRGEGGRRVRNTPSQEAATHAASGSSGGPGGSDTTSSEETDRLARLARAQSELQAANARVAAASVAHGQAEQEYRTASDKLSQEQMKLRAIQDNLKENARDEIIQERSTRAPRTYEKYTQAKEEYQQLETQRSEMQNSLDYYGEHGPHAVQREIVNEALQQSDYSNNHNYRAYQRALQNSPRYGEYQHAQEQIDAYEALSSKTYNAQFQMNRAESQLIGNRLDAYVANTQDPAYLAQRSVVHAASDAVDSARTQMQAAENDFNSAVRAQDNLEESVRVLGRATIGGVVYDSPDSQTAVTSVFGHEVSGDELKAAFGAHPEDNLEIGISYRGAPQFSVSMTSADGERSATMIVARDVRSGAIQVSVGEVRNTGSAAGMADDLVSSMDDMKALGVSKVTAQAARASGGRGGHGYNGYYTWARLGFTGEIPSSVLGAARTEFGNVRTVQDLMQKGPAAQRWWKVNGTSFMATFDFTDGSYSMRTLSGWRAAINRNS